MLVCVTQRSLCPDDFAARLDAITSGGAALVILREKDLGEREYLALAQQCRMICRRQGARLAVHGHVKAARRMDADTVHLPFSLLRAQPQLAKEWPCTGTSVHSVEDARFAQAQGVSYLLAGHVYETTCKPGVPARGIAFLRAVCAAVELPVYAIGGVRMDRLDAIRSAGAAGACVRADWMTCDDPAGTVGRFRARWEEGGPVR